MSLTEPQQLARQVLDGDRRALAQAITLIESARPEDRRPANDLLTRLTPHANHSIRVGISGVPGVGKSTFIEALGNHVIACGHKVAVLAVDPSSALTGGSILGDKTRMETLSRKVEAFIRPSPAGRTLGGVTRHTRETMRVVEAAGFDVVIVETVGVGQSETAVAEMTDLFLLLLLPGGGDELQGIKRGIVELADLVVVNKADGPLTELANRTATDYRLALHLVRPKRPGRETPVLTCSAITDHGLDEVWSMLTGLHRQLAESGELDELRRKQVAAARAAGATWEQVGEALGMSRQSAWEYYAARTRAEIAANAAANTDLSEGDTTDLAVEEVRAVRRRRRAG